MPIGDSDMSMAENHIEWLRKGQHLNVTVVSVDLTEPAVALKATLPVRWHEEESGNLVLANSYARLRMITLYAIATDFHMLVVGTGNKVEDFGVGFFTKYGDGGVDISPLGDLLKSQVYELGERMGILDEILKAPPTDGLWEDGRTDEDQLGATYDELEWAMEYTEKNDILLGLYGFPRATNKLLRSPAFANHRVFTTNREKEVLKIYKTLHDRNQHKIRPIPVFRF
jgi:NAD+ synthase